MDEYRAANQALWDRWTPHHVGSKFYDVEGFKAGRETLDSVELAGFDDVGGKSLLHLQCHFGLDTLSWARHGAVVTGADFSATAIQAARSLALEIDVPATFVHSDLYELPEHLDGQFDCVFTSHGVLGWLPDLDAWARTIAHFLKPGGRFYIVEGHPVMFMYDDERQEVGLHLRYPYFHQPTPLREETKGSYAAPEAPTRGEAYYWIHSIADILGALLRAGLRIETFDEYPYMGWANFPWMECGEDGWWRLPAGTGELPLMFSLRAKKERGA